MAPSARGPAAGFAVQAVLLGLLAALQGLTTIALLLGFAYGVTLCTLLAASLRRHRMHAMGPANAVTLARAILVGGVTTLVATAFTGPISIPLLAGLAAVALALDGVDGQVARRTGTTSALGARFDMEIDAFLILVLSVYAADRFGWWTIAIGAFRYVFVAAIRVAPWLGAALPPRFSRKVVAAVQGVVLATVTVGLLPQLLAVLALTAALAALTWSFGRDIAWLYRASRVRAAARQRWATTPQLVHAR